MTTIWFGTVSERLGKIRKAGRALFVIAICEHEQTYFVPLLTFDFRLSLIWSR